MKKLFLFLGIIIGIFALLFVLKTTSVSGSTDNPYHTPEKDLQAMTRKQLKDPNYQNIILPNDLTKMLSNKESGFVYFFSPECTHCQATTPFLMPLSKDSGVDMKQYNLLEYHDGWSTYKIEYTPTLVYYKDGKEVDRIEGGMLVKDGKPTDDTFNQFKDFFAKYKS